MTDQRNTPEARALPHCETCGATELDGHGKVTTRKGITECRDCRKGARDLVREDPENYEFGPDGRLRRKTVDPFVVDEQAKTEKLHEALTANLYGLESVTVEPVQDRSRFVAVVLPNGYRWHVFTHGNGVLPLTDAYQAVLFSPGRSLAGFPPIALRDLADVRMLVEACIEPGNAVSAAIEADSLARMEIGLFDADAWLASIRGNRKDSDE